MVLSSGASIHRVMSTAMHRERGIDMGPFYPEDSREGRNKFSGPKRAGESLKFLVLWKETKETHDACPYTGPLFSAVSGTGISR